MVKTSEEIRQAVRERYAGVARGSACCEPVVSNECCGPQAKPADQPTPDLLSATSCCVSKSAPSAAQVAEALGYSQDDLQDLPEGANMGLGCGNPQAIAALKPGETVVDLGSGGGIDCFLAAKRVGTSGQVIGVDMTVEMITKARAAAKNANLEHVEFRLGEIEHLPVADNTVDVVISNCVINLSPDKQAVFNEAYRILKPGGRFAVSDIVALGEMPAGLLENFKALTGCVAGASKESEIRGMLEAAGFTDIQFKHKHELKEVLREWAPGMELDKLIASAYITAVK